MRAVAWEGMQTPPKRKTQSPEGPCYHFASHIKAMNALAPEKRVQIISCLVEGNSIRSTSRITGASKNTIVKLLVDVGTACAAYQDKVIRNSHCKRVQCDEI